MILDSAMISMLFQALMILWFYNSLFGSAMKAEESWYYQPKQCTVIQEILQTYHRFVSSSWIPPQKKWVHSGKPTNIAGWKVCQFLHAFPVRKDGFPAPVSLWECNVLTMPQNIMFGEIPLKITI